MLDAFHGTTVTVDVSTTTTFSGPGVSAPTFANVCVGERVSAVGIITSGTMAATNVFITPQPTSTSPDHHPFFGEPKTSSKTSGPKYTDEVTTPAGYNPSNNSGFDPGTSSGWSQHSNGGAIHGSGQSWNHGSGQSWSHGSGQRSH